MHTSSFLPKKANSLRASFRVHCMLGLLLLVGSLLSLCHFTCEESQPKLNQDHPISSQLSRSPARPLRQRRSPTRGTTHRRGGKAGTAGCPAPHLTGPAGGAARRPPGEGEARDTPPAAQGPATAPREALPTPQP